MTHGDLRKKGLLPANQSREVTLSYNDSLGLPADALDSTNGGKNRHKGDTNQPSQQGRAESDLHSGTREDKEQAPAYNLNLGLRNRNEATTESQEDKAIAEGRLAAYCLVRINQLTGQMNRLQQEVYEAHQRLFNTNIPRGQYQTNEGTQTDDRYHPLLGGIATGSSQPSSPSTPLSSTQENMEDREGQNS